MDHTADLDTLYDQSWDRAINQNTLLGSQRARCILMWTTCAKRPLTVKATGEALAASGLGTNEPPLTGAEIVSGCAGFIRVERSAFGPQNRILSENTEIRSDIAIELEDLLPKPGAANADDSIVVFTHLSARRYFEQRKDGYFPYASDTMLDALLSKSDANDVTQALIPQHIFMSRYSFPIFPIWRTQSAHA
jgi:hypothetical protein